MRSSRREFLQIAAATAATIGSWRNAFAFYQSPGTPIPGTKWPGIGKYQTFLRGVGPGGIPVAAPDPFAAPVTGATHYSIGIGQYTDQLHPSLGPTTLWGYNPARALGGGVQPQKHLGGIIVAKKGARGVVAPERGRTERRVQLIGVLTDSDRVVGRAGDRRRKWIRRRDRNASGADAAQECLVFADAWPFRAGNRCAGTLVERKRIPPGSDRGGGRRRRREGLS